MAEFDQTDNPETPDDEFLRLKQWWGRARDHQGLWRQEAWESYDFCAGWQWDEDDINKLKEDARPAVTFNRTEPVVDAVSGMEVSGRHEVTFKPRTMDDQGVNDVLTEAARFFRDECDAEDEESDSFRDLLIAGMGWTETRLDYEENPDGDVKCERVDPLEMYWDPNARKKNLSDARYLFRVKEIAREDAEALFPDADPGSLDAMWASDALRGTQSNDNPDEVYRDDTAGRSKMRKTVRIVEAQWWEREDFWRVQDPQTGQLVSLDPDKYRKLSKAAEAKDIPIQATKQKKRCFYRAFLGSEILGKVERLYKTDTAPGVDRFTFNAMTGKRDRNKGLWYGLVRPMKDPQRWSNKFFSTMLHSMMSQGKGILAERDAFEDQRKAARDYSKPDEIVFVNPGAIAGQKIMPKPAGTFPGQIAQMMEFAVTAIPQVTGVNVELMGTANRDQAASLEYQRRQSGTTMLATMFDALRRYRKEQGRLLLYFIQYFLSDGRLVRIVGDEGARYAPLVHQPGTIEYDVIVDESPTSPNQKEAGWAVMQQMLPVIAKMGIPPEVWVEIARYSPLPNAFTEKLQQILKAQQEAQAKQGPPPDPKMVEVQGKMQLAQQQQQFDQQAEMQRMQAEMQLAQAKQQSDERIAMVKAQADAQIKAMGQQGMADLEAAKTAAEIENTQANTVKTLVEAGVRQQEASVNAMLAETDQQAAQQGIQNSKQESDAKVQKLKQPPPKPKGNK